MNRNVRLLLMISLLAFGPSVLAEPRTFSIDKDHLSIVFLVDHIGYQRQVGQFLDAGGSFVYDSEANRLSSGEVTVSAESVFTNHDRRDRHLRNGDFLDADDHPEIQFVVTHHRAGGENRHEVDGELTLLGQTRPISMEIVLNKAAEYPIGHGEYTLGLSARTTIKRSDWGMDYGISGDLVGDEVELWFEFEAIAD